MSAGTNRLEVRVEDLRKGMYVAELDRPWVEVPLPLQGFPIRSDEELAVLRRYCARVYVDPERCAAAGSERDLPGAAAGRAPARSRSARGGDDDAIDVSRRYPDPDRLRRQVESAGATVGAARGLVDEALQRVERGRGVDVPAASSAVGELAERVTQSPAASLLLTSVHDHDNVTSTHSIHVCLLTLAFCLRAGVEANKLEAFGLGALLHDIGKARLPRELLDRPGPLDEDEWALVRRHPIEGRRILADSGNVPRAVLNVAEMHHERRDGSGYPYGLRQPDLPGYVLVTALANRYQALTSPRPYRDAGAPDRVLQSFYSQADGLYGSRVVEAFIRCVGIYPVGSVVELDSGALAVVVSSRPSARLRPTVQLVRTPDGAPYAKLVLLNLAAEAERRERSDDAHPVRRVRRVRSPSETGIDPGAIIAETFGVQLGHDGEAAQRGGASAAACAPR
ncbi:MAG: HD-GYP domain-containing protein [Halofilum sp. (in: g-proteobacteria)]|nr:HD-GYP domain-containing protein [Halofilum sp. (in: g-proteobacteria)]